MANYFHGRQLGSARMPMDQQLPNRSAGLRVEPARECGDLSLVERMRAAREAPYFHGRQVGFSEEADGSAITDRLTRVGVARPSVPETRVCRYAGL
jgi:hypothetical protein